MSTSEPPSSCPLGGSCSITSSTGASLLRSSESTVKPSPVSVVRASGSVIPTVSTTVTRTGSSSDPGPTTCHSTQDIPATANSARTPSRRAAPRWRRSRTGISSVRS